MHADRSTEATGPGLAAFSRDVLFAVLEDLPIGVAVHVGPEFTYVYLNRALRALSGDRKMLGLPYAEAWPDLADRVVPVMREVLETGKPFQAEDRPFGESRYVTFSFRRIRLDTDNAVLVTARDTTDEVEAQRQAQVEAAQLDEVLERMGDAFFGLDRDWRFTYVNERGARLLARPREELIGESIWDVFPEAKGTAFYSELQRAMREQRPVAFEEYYAPLDMWASVQAHPSPSGLSAFLSNITSLKQREAALATSEAQLRAVIDNSPDIIQMKDLDGTFIRVNDEFARLFGMPKEEVIGKSDRDLLPADTARKLEENDHLVREQGRPVQFEEEVSVPSVGHRLYLTTKFPLKDASGRVYGTAGISADITQRAEQERARRESEERFRKVFEEGPVGIVLVSPDGLEIVRANDTYERMLGYTKEEMTGVTLFDVTHPDDHAKMRQLADLVISGEIPFYRWEKRYVRKDTSVLWVAATGSLMRDEEGRPSLFIDMVEDITQRKQAETALRDKDLAIRKAYSDVIDAVTGGKLVLMTPEELREVLGRQVSREWRAADYEQFSGLRHELSEVLRRQHMTEDDIHAYVLAGTEAVTNSVKHGGGGTMRVRKTAHAVQIEVSDEGPGIDFGDLPRAALVPGYSTKASLGMGFTIMLEVCDRLLLTTQPGLTSIVLEKAI
ncbi:MAG TPA: PAS domain S-box protein [Coriobacteriia bacterium]|jgi:PAS domain S-box-containing protein